MDPKIVTAIIVIVAVLAVVAFFLVSKRRNRRAPSRKPDRPAPEPADPMHARLRYPWKLN